MTKEAKMQIVIDNYFKSECDVNTSIRKAFEKGFRIGVQKGSVDAEPVRHGHWTIEDIVTYERSYGGTLYEPVYKCSCCGRVTESYVRGDEPIMPEDADFPEFCGNCGAKMEDANE